MNETEQKLKPSPDVLFCKNMKISNQAYTLANRIGYGNFGQVFLGVNNSSKNSNISMVAIKIQKQSVGRVPQLPNEISILKVLKADKQSLGFPQIFDHGNQKNSNFLVMELLGPNLNDLMKICGGKFSLSTTLFLTIQIFERIEFIHSKGYIYRDIKPQNFLMGIGSKSSILYMIDFGLSRLYRDPRINLQKPYKQQREFCGTLRYASICSHLRIQYSRRDDLESICYMMIYFLKGKLPWQKNKMENAENNNRLILDRKIKLSAVDLCQGIPLQFKLILQYCLQLEYYEQPDYEKIQGHLMDLYEKIVSGKSFQYDWAALNQQKSIKKDDFVIKINTPNSIKDIIVDEFQSRIDQNQNDLKIFYNNQNEETSFNNKYSNQQQEV